MSLHTAAKYLESQGRGKDTMLVHMTPREVQGLHALAKASGGQLSINPNTGLTEAGWLDNLLPTIAGIGLSFIPGIGPLAAAGMVGGFETLRTGDISKGLMAGLGAYGGAGLGSALSSAGTSAGLGAASAEATAAGTTAGEAALQGPGYEAMKNAGLSDDLIRQSATDFAADNTGQVMRSTGAVQPSVLSGPHVQTANGLMGAPLEAQGMSFTPATQSAMNNPTMGGIKQLGSIDGMKNVYNAMPTGTLPSLAGTAATAMTPQVQQPGEKEMDERYKTSPYSYRLSSNFQGSTPVQPNPYYRPTGLGYAAGGDVMMAQGGAYSDEPLGDVEYMAKGGMSIGDGIYKDSDTDTSSLSAYDAAKKRMQKQFAAANLKPSAMPKTNISSLGDIKTGPVGIAAAAGGSIGGYSDGGRMLKGPGDGMSDSIPAVIGKKQPARLADGEFVVPADVVSHLGNGSTDAGAKRLYAMMDKVRHARTGKKKQAPAVKADKFLPV